MKELFILVSCLFLGGTISRGQSTEEQEVTSVVEEFRKALITPDRATLNHLTSDLLSYGHSNGKIEDKNTFMETLLTQTSDFVSIDLTDQQISISDHVALVRHSFFAHTRDKGKAPGEVRLRILLVWQKQGGRWVLLARQAVKVQ